VILSGVGHKKSGNLAADGGQAKSEAVGVDTELGNVTSRSSRRPAIAAADFGVRIWAAAERQR